MYSDYSIRSSSGCTNPKALTSDPNPGRPYHLLVLCNLGIYTLHSRSNTFSLVSKFYWSSGKKINLYGSHMALYFKTNAAVVVSNCQVVLVNVMNLNTNGKLEIQNAGCSSPDTVGAFGSTKLQPIRTITSGGNSDIYVQTVASTDYLIRLDMATSTSEKINFVTSTLGFNLALNLQGQYLIAWAQEGIYKYDIPTQTITKLADVNYGSTIEDGLIANAVFVDAPPGVPMDATYTDTIFSLETSGTIRVLDLVNMNVTSICAPSNSTSYGMGYVAACTLPNNIVAIHLMPEYHALYVLTSSAWIYMIYVKPDFEGKNFLSKGCFSL